MFLPPPLGEVAPPQAVTERAICIGSGLPSQSSACVRIQLSQRESQGVVVILSLEWSHRRW